MKSRHRQEPGSGFESPSLVERIQYSLVIVFLLACLVILLAFSFYVPREKRGGPIYKSGRYSVYPAYHYLFVRLGLGGGVVLFASAAAIAGLQVFENRRRAKAAGTYEEVMPAVTAWKRRSWKRRNRKKRGK